MKIIRRSFIATLFAPLVVRWMPKPVGERVFSEELLAKSYAPIAPYSVVNDNGYVYWWRPMATMIGTGNNDGTVTVTQLWRKYHAPFVVMPPIEKYPWETPKDAA